MNNFRVYYSLLTSSIPGSFQLGFFLTAHLRSRACWDEFLETAFGDATSVVSYRHWLTGAFGICLVLGLWLSVLQCNFLGRKRSLQVGAGGLIIGHLLLLGGAVGGVPIVLMLGWAVVGLFQGLGLVAQVLLGFETTLPELKEKVAAVLGFSMASGSLLAALTLKEEERRCLSPAWHVPHIFLLLANIIYILLSLRQSESPAFLAILSRDPAEAKAALNALHNRRSVAFDVDQALRRTYAEDWQRQTEGEAQVSFARFARQSPHVGFLVLLSIYVSLVGSPLRYSLLSAVAPPRFELVALGVADVGVVFAIIEMVGSLFCACLLPKQRSLKRCLDYGLWAALLASVLICVGVVLRGNKYAVVLSWMSGDLIMFGLMMEVAVTACLLTPIWLLLPAFLSPTKYRATLTVLCLGIFLKLSLLLKPVFLALDFELGSATLPLLTFPALVVLGSVIVKRWDLDRDLEEENNAFPAKLPLEYLW